MSIPTTSSSVVPNVKQLVYVLTNVYNQFSFKLTMSRYKYKLWCMIFQDICKGAKVIGHINGKSKPTSEDDEDWKSIDSQVNSWFYSPYEPYLLQIISNDNCTTKDIWKMHRSPLSGIFSTTIELFFCGHALVPKLLRSQWI